MQFVSSLRKENFQEFWLCYSAFHLTSTATLLVRCALETTESHVTRSCLASVETLRIVLRRVREEEDWDVADMCLDHCDKILYMLRGIGGSVEEDFSTLATDDSRVINPAAMSLPETQINNEIIDMMSISGTFGVMDGFPFSMTGIWDMPAFQDTDL